MRRTAEQLGIFVFILVTAHANASGNGERQVKNARLLEDRAVEMLRDGGAGVIYDWFKDGRLVPGHWVTYWKAPSLSQIRPLTHFLLPYRIDFKDVRLKEYHLEALVLLEDLDVLNMVNCSLPEGGEELLRTQLDSDVDLNILAGGSTGVFVMRIKDKPTVKFVSSGDGIAFKYGDIVLAINGERTRNVADFIRLENEISESESFTAKVLRNGTEIEFRMKALNWTFVQDEIDFWHSDF